MGKNDVPEATYELCSINTARNEERRGTRCRAGERKAEDHGDNGLGWFNGLTLQKNEEFGKEQKVFSPFYQPAKTNHSPRMPSGDDKEV